MLEKHDTNEFNSSLNFKKYQTNQNSLKDKKFDAKIPISSYGNSNMTKVQNMNKALPDTVNTFSQLYNEAKKPNRSKSPDVAVDSSKSCLNPSLRRGAMCIGGGNQENSSKDVTKKGSTGKKFGDLEVVIASNSKNFRDKSEKDHGKGSPIVAETPKDKKINLLGKNSMRGNTNESSSNHKQNQSIQYSAKSIFQKINSFPANNNSNNSRHKKNFDEWNEKENMDLQMK